MKIGFVSDTHGNLSGLLDIVNYFLEELAVEKVFHLGDYYSDVDELFSLKRSLIKGSTEYTDHDFLSDISHFMSQKITEKSLDPQALLHEDEISRLRRVLVRVPEAGNPLFVAGEIPKATLEMIGDRIALLVHNVKELKKEDVEGADIIMYGGTHLYQVDNFGGRWFINPGHFMEEDDKGRPGSFGVLETTPQGLKVGLYTKDRAEILSRILTFGPRTKMTVK